MLQKATRTNIFHFQPESGISPFMGFMSFQHFRGEKLYSDCVVLPERNYTETEHYECYPIPAYVEQNGREEGYYPDSSVVYIRALWKEFEPERGVYNFELMDQILADALAHRQTLIFRLMAHSTRACDDVPEWLKSLIPCPERPDGMRVKDSPTDPLFIELFCEAVKKIAERYDGNPVFDCIDISLPGSWGEGHNLHLYAPEDLQKMVDTYVHSFKHTQLIGQCSRPELLQYASQYAPIGWRGDGLGEPAHTFERYPERISRIPELWKQGPVSFESYWWLGEWQRKGWDIDRIIDLTLSWHISSFNAKSLPVPNDWKDKVDAWVSKMGYHFVIDYARLPETACAGDTMELALGIDNRGVAPLYRKLPLQVRFVNADGAYVVDTDADVTAWFPGKTDVLTSCEIPAGIGAGEYEVEIAIRKFLSVDPEITAPVFFATDAERDGEFYKIGKITIA